MALANNLDPAPFSSGPSLFLDAFFIALNQALDGNGWYTSTLELQLTSLGLCEACRGVPTLELTVERGVIPLLWPVGTAEATTRSRAGAPKLSRVPALRPLKVVWKAAALSMRHAGDALARVECLVFGDAFDYRVNRVVWPPGLKKLVFGKDFDRSRALARCARGVDLRHVVQQAAREFLLLLSRHSPMPRVREVLQPTDRLDVVASFDRGAPLRPGIQPADRRGQMAKVSQNSEVRKVFQPAGEPRGVASVAGGDQLRV